MAPNQKPSMDGYYAAMDWLYDNKPHMMEYIASLGAPKSDRRVSRAMVVAGPNYAPRLYANDEFLQKIGPAQAAGVLVHEWRHVLLDHHGEALNPKPAWRYERVLSDAHEVIINDSIELTGYELPDDVIRGANRGGHFYGYWTTDEAYGPMEEWYLEQQQNQSGQDQDPNQQPQQEQQGEDDDHHQDSGAGADGGSGAASGSPGKSAPGDSSSGAGGSSSEGSGDQPEDSSESGQSGESSSAQQQDQSDSGSQDENSPSDSSEGTDGSDSGAGSEDGTPADGESAGSSADGDGESEGPENSSSGGSSENSEAGEADASGSSSGDATDDGGEADAEGSKGDSTDGSEDTGEGSDSGDADDSTDGDGLSGCGHGTYIEDEDGNLREMDEGELQEFVDNLNQILADVISKNPMPDDEKPTENDLDRMDQDVAEAINQSRAQAFSRAGNTPTPAQKVLAGGKLHLGWLKLLQKINPEVGKEDGGLNAKASYNWARPRRTTSLIRGVHLPTPGAPRDKGTGTKQKPIALIALDFSQSIDRRLAHAMKDMAQSIPEQHIEARCITFSTEAIPFDFRAKSNTVAEGGTDFSCIELEARKIEKETGQYPYVICLTDGEAWFNGYGRGYYGYNRGGAAAPTQAQLDRNWLWVDVITEDDSQAFRRSSVDPKVRAQVNLTALPYDRSKL